MEQMRLDKIRSIQVVNSVIGRTGNCRPLSIFTIAVPTYNPGSRKSLQLLESLQDIDDIFTSKAIEKLFEFHY